MDDEPGWSWPAWKFGMKRCDLFTKLHDEYNTLSTPIQDREAFHSDVYEVSSRAQTNDEFHQLMAQRKEQRLMELNSGLELASVKIISNPTLIGTEQWPLAVQLFRERSLDSLVRYFSSYLPESQYDSDAETLDSHSVHSDISRSSTTSISTATTDVHSEAPPSEPFFNSGKQMMTHEPLSIKTDIRKGSCPDGPLSPPSSHADDDSVSSSPTDVDSEHDEFPISHPTPASRSMSFSGSETGPLHLYHSDVSSEVDTRPCTYDSESKHGLCKHDTPYCDDPAEIDFDCSQPDDTFDPQSFVDTQDNDPTTDDNAPEPEAQPAMDVGSDTPTPRPHTNQATCYISAKLATHLQRSPSPSPRARLANCEARKSLRMRNRELSPQSSRSPSEVLSRIQKPLTDQARCRRTRGRKRMEIE